MGKEYGKSDILKLKFGKIKGASLFTLSGHLKCNLSLQYLVHKINHKNIKNAN